MPTTIKLPRAECTKFDLPPVCIVTGSQNDIVWEPCKFQYMPRWSYFIGGVILGSIFMKKMTADMPFTAAAASAYRRAKLMVYVNVALFIGLFVAAGAGAAALGDKGAPIVLVAVLGSLVAILGIWLALIRNRSPQCLWMNEEFVELRIPSADACQAMRERFGAERTAPRTFMQRLFGG